MESIKEYFLKNIEVTDDKKDKVDTKELFNSFCEEKSIKNITQRKFNSIVNELGYSKKKSNGKTYFSGIKIKKEEDEIESETSETFSEIESEQEIIPEPINEIKKEQVSKPREYIKFRDCCLHIPTFTCIKETPNLNYMLINSTDLETIKNKLYEIKYFKTVKECCEFYENLEEEISKINIKDDLKIASVIILTGSVYSKYNKNRGLIICDTYEEFEKKIKNKI
jgi:hypothetical protein